VSVVQFRPWAPPYPRFPSGFPAFQPICLGGFDSRVWIIKHDRRYFFLRSDYNEDDELFHPAEVLKLIFSYAEEVGLFVVLPAGTSLFRARRQPKDEVYATAGTLGPPPVEHAIQTNRMSPPGVVMTYVSDDVETALAETAVKSGRYAIGEFLTERDALILDLSRLPRVPSIFAELPDSLEYDPRPRLHFLHQISQQISRPIARDDRVHIEYVPTQVVTEYLRTIITIDGKPVDRIRYRSSRRNVQTSLVLFANQVSSKSRSSRSSITFIRIAGFDCLK
jgi:hypothetical protein